MKKRDFTKFVIMAVASAMLMISGVAVHAAEALVKTEDGSGIQTEILYAGQTIVAGTVTMRVSGEDLLVTYTTEAGWELAETHLWAGADLADMPQTRQGNPKIGNFPLKNTFDSGVIQQSYRIPLNFVLNFVCPASDAQYFIAAHATVQLKDGYGGVIQQETAWANGDRFVTRGMWGTFSTVTLTCGDIVTGPPTEGSCETAFAYSGGTNTIDGDITHSFLEIVDEDGGDFNRWGWSNGAIGPGEYTWNIYAGAGQSDITKGTLVGTLTVLYVQNEDGTGGTASVWFDMAEGSPYYMDENHLYVGNEILPRDVNGKFTVAPGQYPTIHDELNNAITDSYNVEGLSGNIYVVAHATVCGFTE